MANQNEVSDSAVIEAYKDKGNVLRTARYLNVSEGYVYGVLKKNNVERDGLKNYRLKSTKMTPDKISQAVDLLNKGFSVAKIALGMGVNAEIVHRALQKIGAKVRTKIRLNEAEKQKIVSMVNQGLSYKKIGLMLGRTEPTIISFIHKNHPEIKRQRYRAGENSPHWRGGRYIHKGEYVWVQVPKDSPVASMADKRGYALEHRYVMAESLGRPLYAHETVHHIDGDKLNNKIENLQLRQGKHGKHSKFVCRSCGSHDVVPCPLD